MNAVNQNPEQRKRWLWNGRILLLILAAIVFSYLHKHGISPVWAAVGIVCCRGFFRFLYVIACFIVTAAIIVAILSNLIY